MMKRNIFYLLLLAGLSGTFSSCKKKCSIPDEDTNKAPIVQDVIIYPKSGYITTTTYGTIHVYDGSPHEDKFEISFDGGVTRKPFSAVSSQYSILGVGTQVKCDAAFTRSVDFDAMNNVVTYTVVISECDNGCDELRGIENYVLVPSIPTSYYIFFDVQKD